MPASHSRRLFVAAPEPKRLGALARLAPERAAEWEAGFEAGVKPVLEALEEQASLTQRMAERARELGNGARRIGGCGQHRLAGHDRARSRALL